MTDRDDYPNDPYRGRAERGYDYDPLSDPLPAQPPPRGRRARPEPGDRLEPGPWHEPEAWPQQPMTGHEPQEPSRGRRRRPETPRPDGEPPRRSGAADAVRGGRAARTGRSGEQHPADPAQDALAALAGLGGPSAQAPGADAPVHGSSPWTGTPSDPFPAEEADPRPRRGRRRRGAPDTDPQGFEEQPAGRRSRRRARRADRDEGGFLSEVPDETDVFDSGSFPGVDTSADSGVFSRVREDGEESEEAPRRRGGRRRRRGEDSGAMPAQDPADSGAHDSGALYAGAAAAAAPGPEPEPEPEEEPRRRRGGRRARRAARRQTEEEAAHAAEPAEEEETEEEPRSRRRGRTRRSRRKQAAAESGPAEESTEAEPEPEPEDDEDYEPGLADIAEAYGGSRSSRRKLKEAKRRAQNKGKKAKAGRGGKRKSRMGVLAVVLLLVIAGGGFGVVRTYVFPADYEGEGSGEVDFVIEEGDSGTAVAQKLADENVVASVRAFTNALGAVPDQELSPGTYRLAEEMSGEHAVEALLDPDNRLGGRVSIPEGLRATDIMRSVAEQTAISEEELQEAYGQTEELNLPDYATEGPEGYLFPSTYRFEPDAEALSVLKTMVTQHRQVAEEIELEERAGQTQYDPNEIMAIASIVQAESGNVDDMPKISRVVHNRLDIDMPLQMDSTCFYAIDDYGIALDNDQLAECEADDSGFDTYYSTGLIPGPFVAPGEDAIEAALEPEQGDWLYFVATDPENGVSEFTDDHDEFEVLKERFQENWGGE